MRIDKLTQKQKNQLKEVRGFWVNESLYGKDEIDIEKVKLINTYYQKAGFSDPKIVVISSPLAIQLFCNLLRRRQSEVANEVRNEVRNEVANEVANEVWREVANEVANEVRSEVESEVSSEVENEVENEVEKRLKLYSWSESLISDSYWVAYYHFFYLQKLYPERVKKNLEHYVNFLQSGVFMSVALENYFVVCPRPMNCRKNDRGLHSDEFPVLEWRDGYKIYALNGIRFKKDLWEKITSKTLTEQEFFAIEDVDQRTQALAYMGHEFIIKHTNGELIDEYIKYYVVTSHGYVLVDKNNPIAKTNTYKLYKMPPGEIFSTDAYYCLFDCPSTGKWHLEGVEVSKTVPEAMSWAMKITPEEWEKLIPLEHET